MISVDNTFVSKFINDNESYILQCVKDLSKCRKSLTKKYPKKFKLSKKEIKFCDKLYDERKRLIEMGKNEMINFVTNEMKNEPYIIYWHSFEINNLKKIGEEKFKDTAEKNNIINEINKKYLLNIQCDNTILDSKNRIEFKDGSYESNNFIIDLNNKYSLNIQNDKKTLIEILDEADKQLDFDFKKINEVMSLMFNYKTFSTEYSFEKPKEGTKAEEGTKANIKLNLACLFVLESKLKCCPYCNRAFIETYDKNMKRTATLDHYFPQSLYPFFAISPWNLIPSCYSCNNIKRNPNTMENPHFYPYEWIDPMALYFEVVPKDKKINYESFDYSDTKKFKVIIKPEESSMTNEAQQSKNTFHLEQLYQNNKETVTAIYELLRFKGEEFFDEISRYFINDDDVSKEALQKIHEKTQDFLYIRKRMIFPYGEKGLLGKLSKDILDFFTTINKKNNILN